VPKILEPIEPEPINVDMFSEQAEVVLQILVSSPDVDRFKEKTNKNSSIISFKICI